jgi:hypothetical protein
VVTFPSARAMRWLSAAVAIWTAFWIALAAYTAYVLATLRGLGDTVVKAGVATESTGHALAAIGHLPFVGGQIGRLAAQAVAAGASARASGATTNTTIDQLAVLLGIAIGLVPTLPLLALYLPLLIGWRRDRRAVRRALAGSDGEPELEAMLARRALARLTFDELRTLGPATNVELAAAELRRLGLDRPARQRSGPRRRPERVRT